MAFVRLLLTKAKWNLLDEITSSIDEDLESELYDRLIRELPDATIISIAHRSTLRSFHLRELRLETDGGWDISEINRADRRQRRGHR